MILSPAYSQVYKSKTEVLTALQNGKDFVIEDFMHPDCGRYVSLAELPTGTPLEIRYGKNHEKCMTYRVTDKDTRRVM